MPLVRPALVLAVGASLVVATGAGAVVKPKPVCNLVTDAAGDATGFIEPSTPLPSDPNLDILTADIAGDGKKVTAVIRVAALGADSTSPTGDTFYFNFSVNGTKYYLSAAVKGTTASYSAGDFSGTSGTRNGLGAADGFLDSAHKAVHITAPASYFGAKPGATITDLDALGQRYISAGGPALTPTADDAPSPKSIKVGTLSCVKPGK